MNQELFVCFSFNNCCRISSLKAVQKSETLRNPFYIKYSFKPFIFSFTPSPVENLIPHLVNLKIMNVTGATNTPVDSIS